jgi:hypothetical protein
MMKTITYGLLSIFIYSLIGCADQTQEDKNTAQENGWELEKRVSKKVDNLYFTFPSEGYAFDNRDSLVKDCFKAIKENCARLELPDYNTPLKITFLNTREEMEKEVGFTATGWTNMWTQEIHIVANNEFTPPIKHELMHMITMTTWGYPHEDLVWINEGLATTTVNRCNGYTIGEVYRYFIEKEMLISMDSLTNDFHREPSIISYHQSAHIVEYLLANHGLQKFEELWKKGFPFFEEIYSISFAQMEEEINRKTLEKYPTAVTIDWDVFKNGCF